MSEKYGDVFPVTQAYLAWHEKRSAKEKEKRVQASGDGAYYRIDEFNLAGELEDSHRNLPWVMILILNCRFTHRMTGHPWVCRCCKGGWYTGLRRCSDNEDITPVKMADHYYRFRLRFTNIGLLPGSYNLRGHSMDPEGVRVFDNREIQYLRSPGNTKEVGYIRLPHEWLD